MKKVTNFFLHMKKKNYFCNVKSRVGRAHRLLRVIGRETLIPHFPHIMFNV